MPAWTAESPVTATGGRAERDVTMRRDQYSPSGRPAGGVARMRTRWRWPGSSRTRRGKARSQAAADGWSAAGWGIRASPTSPAESVAG
jgi:hypothetical protein